MQGKQPNSKINGETFRFATKWDKFCIFVALVAIFVAGITTPFAIALLANVFQAMIDYDKSSNDSATKSDVLLNSVHRFGTNYSCVGLLLFVGGYLGTTLMNIAAINQIFRIRIAYYKAALNQDFAYFDLHRTGDFVSTMAETTQSLQMASTQVQNAFAFAPDFRKGINAAARIVDLIHTKPNILDPKQPVDFKSNGDASFEAVEFTYPSRPSVRVLRGLNLHIHAGKTIALVGQSGCGKSTVIQLLQRYYDSNAGIIALDDIPLTKLRVNEIRATFDLVSQEPVLFDRTIFENIAYGNNSKAVTEEEIIEAAKQANIHEFIVSLPLGYDTDIGTKGTQLSGGQKQRVAIARALIRQPKILLLDEATSALDNESEKVVQDALDAAKAERTCVMIAHRLGTVRDADAICVLSNGRVAELGTHAELMHLQRLYYNLHVKNYLF